jgi:hypothetical protein
VTNICSNLCAHSELTVSLTNSSEKNNAVEAHGEWMGLATPYHVVDLMMRNKPTGNNTGTCIRDHKELTIPATACTRYVVEFQCHTVHAEGAVHGWVAVHGEVAVHGSQKVDC